MSKKRSREEYEDFDCIPIPNMVNYLINTYEEDLLSGKILINDVVKKENVIIKNYNHLEYNGFHNTLFTPWATNLIGVYTEENGKIHGLLSGKIFTRKGIYICAPGQVELIKNMMLIYVV